MISLPGTVALKTTVGQDGILPTSGKQDTILRYSDPIFTMAALKTTVGQDTILPTSVKQDGVLRYICPIFVLEDEPIS